MSKRRGHKGGKKLKLMGAHLGTKGHTRKGRGRKHGGKKR
jgi:hypothetical protein